MLARVQERAPRGERVGQDQAQILLVPDLERPGRPCGAEPAAGGEIIHLLVRQDSEQAICVATVRSEHDAAPNAVDSDRADAAIPAVTRRLKERPGVGLPGELGDGRIDRASRVPVQLRVFCEKFLPDRQARHWLHPPWPAIPGWLPKGMLDDPAHERRRTGTLRAGTACTRLASRDAGRGSLIRVKSSSLIAYTKANRGTAAKVVPNLALRSALRVSGPVEGFGVGEHAAEPGLIPAQDADLEVRLPFRLGRGDLVGGAEVESEPAVVAPGRRAGRQAARRVRRPRPGRRA